MSRVTSSTIWRMQHGPDGIILSLDCHVRGERLAPDEARRLADALVDAAEKVEASCRREEPLPLHRSEAGCPRCSTCDGGGRPDCTDPA